ncbi:hypothetical protein Fmac_022432 [Flemingia macrophylla]|uniref:Mei2-like C-terminal RNA recognition motif domain-containing protein n=1 Tax=Flemingia macrophylla TaxID=520843 RepID=A0ABD1LZQ7_9FABA
MSSLNPQAPEFFPTNFTPLYFHYFLFSRELHPFFYPTTTLPLPPPSTVITHQLSPLSQDQPTRFRCTKDDPNPAENNKEGVAKSSKVFKAFIRCGTRSDGLSLKANYARRRRNGEDNKSECFRNRYDDARCARDKQCFRAFPRKKRCYPLLPVRVDGGDTTVMIRNIPSKYTRDMLVDFLDNHCLQVNLRDEEASKEKGGELSVMAFDFLYLPIDFMSGLNKGYAFVNFTKPQAAWKFLLTASNMKWDLFQSHKIREVGKEKLEEHFETMNFPCESEDVLPVCFSPPRDGVIKGNQRTVGKLFKRKHPFRSCSPYGIVNLGCVVGSTLLVDEGSTLKPLLGMDQFSLICILYCSVGILILVFVSIYVAVCLYEISKFLILVCDIWHRGALVRPWRYVLHLKSKVTLSGSGGGFALIEVGLKWCKVGRIQLLNMAVWKVELVCPKRLDLGRTFLCLCSISLSW